MISIFYLLSRLPLAWLHALGALLGWLAWLLSPTYRRHLRENMTLALGADGALYVNSRVGLAINRYVLGGGVATTASVVVPSCAAAPTLAPPACLTDQPEQLLAVPTDPTAAPPTSTTTTPRPSTSPVVTPAFTG